MSGERDPLAGKSQVKEEGTELEGKDGREDGVWR